MHYIYIYNLTHAKSNSRKATRLSKNLTCLAFANYIKFAYTHTPNPAILLTNMSVLPIEVNGSKNIQE